MKAKYLPILLLIVCLPGCQKPIDKEALKEEIRQAEQAFNDYAKEYGVKEAFLAFAHEEAVINRGDSIIPGLEGIRSYFENQTLMDVELKWKPSFIDVSSSGDLAYTYGKYTFKATAPDSTRIEASGIFHTVWKRDENGDWKYVYD